MKKLLTLLLLISFIAPIALSLYAQEEKVIEQIQVIREAQEANKNRVAVTGDLTDDIFEVIVMARMKHAKPRIHNVIVVGSGLGRLSCETKEILVATTKDEGLFLTKRKDKGFISFDKSEAIKTVKTIGETNVRKGRLTKALYGFMIPRDKVKKDKKYKLWVQILSSQKGSKHKTFKFDLGDFLVRLNESAAITGLNAISAACERFRSAQTPLAYPANLAALSPYIDADIVDATSADRTKKDYYYTYVQLNADEFTCTAIPVTSETNDATIARTFFMDESGVIKVHETSYASTE